MDLREIIKWFIPCFHILLIGSQYNKIRWSFVCLFLFYIMRGARAAPAAGGAASRIVDAQTKNVDSLYETYLNVNQSDSICNEAAVVEPKQMSEGRTFGRPFKKLVAGLLPVIFQLGAASTWAVLAALVGLKTLAVATLILKLLLLAGALKVGALFGQKHHAHGWEAPPHPHHGGWEAPPHPSKEIHLHIHNSGQPAPPPDHTAYSGWSRNGPPVMASSASGGGGGGAGTVDNNINVVYEPYADGPPTISTPYGNYVKVQNTLSAPLVV